jgi:hypothetical protein
MNKQEMIAYIEQKLLAAMCHHDIYKVTFFRALLKKLIVINTEDTLTYGFITRKAN